MSRDYTIDFLRFIGLSFIILAHVNPPFYISHLRCFDVVLMVFVSGLVYNGKKINSIYDFIINRFKRLIYPVFIFLTLYFGLVGILYSLGIDFGVTFRHVYRSYMLLDGIGYVWIIRVFLLVALATPFLLRINDIINSNILFLIINLTIILCLTLLIDKSVGMNNVLIREYIYYLIGYSVIFLVGLRIRILKNKQLNYTLLLMLIFIICSYLYYYSITGDCFIPFNNYKYPPRLYYVLYGLIVSVFLYILTRKVTRQNKFISFIGSNTIWIYLYHIPVVQVVMTVLKLPWGGVNYVLVYVLSVFICYIHVYIIDKISIKYKLPIFKYLKG